MSKETLREPLAAEQELQRVLEIYRDSPLSTLETYAYFGADGVPEAVEERAFQRQGFLAGEIRNPNLAYPKVRTEEAGEELTVTEKLVLDLMKDSINLAYDSDREIALYDILRIRYLEVAMLQISRRFALDDNLSEDEQRELATMFNLANDEVHGYLDSAQYFGLMQKVHSACWGLLRDDKTPAAVLEAADYILMNTAVDEDDAEPPVEVNNVTLSALRQLVIQEHADILACVPDKPDGEIISIDELEEMFRKAHQIRQTGWEVRQEAGKSNVDTRQSEKTTVIGTERALSDHIDAAKVLLHENGVHVERRKQGDELGDPLLSGTGLARYLDAEEGFAKILEEIFEGKTKEAGVQYYLGLGLARGLDGQPRDFRDVFEVDWRRRIVEKYVANPSKFTNKTVESAKNTAYNAAVRIFRGTPCNIPGMVYTKDQAYFIGNQKMWGYFSDIAQLPTDERKRAFQFLFKAKFDPTDELQRRLVEKASANASGG